MIQNVGGTDKTIRIVFGLTIIIIGIMAKSWWGVMGIIPLATGLVGLCPAYLPFGIKTCKTRIGKAPGEQF
jgi:hypothetical protein